MIVEVGCLKYISNNDDRNGCPSDIFLPTSQNIPHKAVQTRIDYLLELWCNNTCDTAFTNSTQPWFECYQTEMVWIRNACTQSNSTPCNLTPSFLSRICTHAHPHTPQTHTHTHTNIPIYSYMPTFKLEGGWIISCFCGATTAPLRKRPQTVCQRCPAMKQRVVWQWRETTGCKLPPTVTNEALLFSVWIFVLSSVYLTICYRLLKIPVKTIHYLRVHKFSWFHKSS